MHWQFEVHLVIFFPGLFGGAEHSTLFSTKLIQYGTKAAWQDYKQRECNNRH